MFFVKPLSSFLFGVGCYSNNNSNSNKLNSSKLTMKTVLIIRGLKKDIRMNSLPLTYILGCITKQRISLSLSAA